MEHKQYGIDGKGTGHVPAVGGLTALVQQIGNLQASGVNGLTNARAFAVEVGSRL